MLTLEKTQYVEVCDYNVSRETRSFIDIYRRAVMNKITEKEAKINCITLVEAYPIVKKQIECVMEDLKDSFEHFKECIDDKKYSEARRYELDEYYFKDLRKKVNKAFSPFTNDTKHFLDATKDMSYTAQEYYTELQKLYQKAIEYRKEVRQEIGYLKDRYLMYRVEICGKPKVRDFMEIAEKSAYRNTDK